MPFFPPLQNIMTFNKCSISGKCYGDVLDDNGVQVDPESVSPCRNSHAFLPISESSPILQNSPRVESRCRDQRCETQRALSDSNSPLDLSCQKSSAENFSGVKIRGLSIPVPKNQF